MFYVYEYYNTETLEVFYVGKGTRNRYRTIAGRNELFLQYYQNNKCDVRIVKYFDNEDEAFQYEQKLIEYYLNIIETDGINAFCKNVKRKGYIYTDYKGEK